MATIRAIFENGVFRPIEPVQLPEHGEFAFEPRLIAIPSEPTPEVSPGANAGLENIYGILSERYSSGHSDTAERHNEHQP